MGHCAVNPKTKPHCPGEAFPWAELLARLRGEEAQPLYRVQVGAFRNRDNAQAYLEKLQEVGVEGFIVEE